MKILVEQEISIQKIEMLEPNLEDLFFLWKITIKF